jgi:streptogramin lyase
MEQPTLINKVIILSTGGIRMRTPFVIRKFISLMLTILSGTIATAHPGSGIVVDKYGQVYFTDTGKGVWKIDKQGKLTYLPASRFHWMAIDEVGNFSESQKNFGDYFERVTMKSVKPSIMMCSDFPFTVNLDGNIYYADTRPSAARIVRRTPDGKETVLASDRIFEFISGICAGPDSSLYITEASKAGENTIRKITLDGKISILATFVGKEGKDLPLGTLPSYCRGLAVDSTGVVFVAATGSRSILKITPQGEVTTILQEPSPWAPTGIALYHGEVYVLEWHDVAPSLQEVREAWIPRIRKIEKDGRVTTLVTISRN